MNNSTQSKNNPTHSAPIMYLYLIRRQKAPATRASLSGCAQCLRLLPPAAPRCTGGLVKNAFADLNTQRA